LNAYFNFVAGYKVKSNKFWIGASSISCPSVLRWCNWKDNPLVGYQLKWAPNEPSKDAAKECVYLEYSDKTGKFLFGKENCRKPLYYLCGNVNNAKPK